MYKYGYGYHVGKIQDGALLNPEPILLERNSDIVEIGGYPAITTNNYSIGLKSTGGRSFLNKSNITKVRQNETITKVSFALRTLSDLTSFFFDVWRKDGATYDNICHVDIFALISAGVNDITLPTPVAVQEGDFIGLGGRSTISSGSTDFSTVAGNGDCNYTSAIAIGNDFNFDGAGLLTNSMIPIKAFGQSPMLVCIGDSIMAGHPGHYSFREVSTTVSLLNQIPSQLTLLDAAYIYQNMGLGGQATTAIAARFDTDVVALKPKIALINGGVNDLMAGNVTKATFLANYTAMLNACVAASIVPVVCKIIPWTNGTNEQMIIRDEWNADLAALVATYTGAICIDFDTAIGKFREGGAEGNLWDIQTTPDYNRDGVHLELAGYAKMAEVIDIEIKKKYTFA